MNELLKNLKTLLFAYMSVIVLLFFAVLQSNQEQYDTAIQQLNEIATISASVDDQSILEIINQAHPERDNIESNVYSLTNLGISIEFKYKHKSFDFSPIKGRLQGTPAPGFDFGRSSITRIPDNFTKTERPVSFLIPVLQPTSITQYKALHDSTLEDVIIYFYEPDFSFARIEAYQYKTSSVNTIVSVNISELEKTRIIDQATLSASSKQAEKTCTLNLAKTSINDRYIFICDISTFSIDNIKYSGARLLIPSHFKVMEIKKNQLMKVFSIPEHRRITFNDAYNELSELTRVYSSLQFPTIENIIKDEKNRNPSKLSIFGAEINIPILTKLIFPILIIMAIYTLLHLNEACRKIRILSKESIDKIDVPWIGLYTHDINKYAILIQLIVFPIILLALIQYKEGFNKPDLLSWSFFVVLMLVNIFNYRQIVSLRSILKTRQAE